METAYAVNVMNTDSWRATMSPSILEAVVIRRNEFDMLLPKTATLVRGRRAAVTMELGCLPCRPLRALLVLAALLANGSEEKSHVCRQGDMLQFEDVHVAI